MEDEDGRWGFWVVLMQMEMEMGSGRDSSGGGGASDGLDRGEYSVAPSVLTFPYYLVPSPTNSQL